MSSPRLNQPWRAALAGGLVVVAVLVVLAAIWCWQHGIIRYDIPANGGTPELVSTRFVGSWLTIAVGLGTVAALLLVGAGCQVLLAIRTRDSHPLPPIQTAEAPAA